MRREVGGVAVEAVQRAELGIAKPRCVLQHGLKDRLQFAGRRTDDAQHIGSSRLLIQRFCQFVRALLLCLKQPHVLYGYHCLVREGFEQGNLPLARARSRRSQHLLALRGR